MGKFVCITHGSLSVQRLQEPIRKRRLPLLRGLSKKHFLLALARVGAYEPPRRERIRDPLGYWGEELPAMRRN